jgi:threonine/homoserine/homoserine lactone efflux protein
MSIFLKGIALGLVLATLVGPIFFILIKTSITKGFQKASIMAVGITLSDVFYIFLIYFGFAQFSDNELFIKSMGLGGGGLLTVFGLVTLIKKNTKVNTDTVVIDEKDLIKYFFKGFSLNFINPAVFLFWVGAVGTISLEHNYDNVKIVFFFLGTVITVLFTDLLKAYIAQRLSSLISQKFLNIITKTSGSVMLLYGLKLMIEQLFFT